MFCVFKMLGSFTFSLYQLTLECSRTKKKINAFKDLSTMQLSNIKQYVRMWELIVAFSSVIRTVKQDTFWIE